MNIIRDLFLLIFLVIINEKGNLDIQNCMLYDSMIYVQVFYSIAKKEEGYNAISTMQRFCSYRTNNALL